MRRGVIQEVMRTALRFHVDPVLTYRNHSIDFYCTKKQPKAKTSDTIRLKVWSLQSSRAESYPAPRWC